MWNVKTTIWIHAPTVASFPKPTAIHHHSIPKKANRRRKDTLPKPFASNPEEMLIEFLPQLESSKAEIVQHKVILCEMFMKKNQKISPNNQQLFIIFSWLTFIWWSIPCPTLAFFFACFSIIYFLPLSHCKGPILKVLGINSLGNLRAGYLN